jgi:hypothetical protein
LRRVLAYGVKIIIDQLETFQREIQIFVFQQFMPPNWRCEMVQANRQILKYDIGWWSGSFLGKYDIGSEGEKRKAEKPKRHPVSVHDGSHSLIEFANVKEYRKKILNVSLSPPNS